MSPITHCVLCNRPFTEDAVLKDTTGYGHFALCLECKVWTEAWGDGDEYVVFLQKTRPFSLVTSVLQGTLMNIQADEKHVNTENELWSLQNNVARQVQKTVSDNIALFCKEVGVESAVAEAWLRGKGFTAYPLKKYSEIDITPIINK